MNIEQYEVLDAECQKAEQVFAEHRSNSREQKQAYPVWQNRMEQLQLKLNHASVIGDMKAMGHYTMLINQIWDKVHANE